MVSSPADAAARPLHPDASCCGPRGTWPVLSATDFDRSKPAKRSLVFAYDLTTTDPGTVAALRERAPGQVLFERATLASGPCAWRQLRSREARRTACPLRARSDGE
jgi:hypothetical protein